MSRRLKNLNPYDLHKHLINEYVLKRPGDTSLLQRDTSKDKTDHDVLREEHRFLWDDDTADTWEKRLAKKYFDKLFKEYAIADLSLYKQNKIALRWRIEKEVVAGKGQFICGNKACGNSHELRSWEVNFAYVEQNEKKNALVKLRLCPECSEKLNYHTKKREIKRLKKQKRHSSVSKSSSSSMERSQSREKSAVPTTSRESQMEEDRSPPREEIEKLEESCWKKGPEIEDKSREEEFDEYLENLLL